MKPTIGQLEELWRQIGTGRVTRSSLDRFLKEGEASEDRTRRLIRTFFRKARKAAEGITDLYDRSKAFVEIVIGYIKAGDFQEARKAAEGITDLYDRSKAFVEIAISLSR